MNHSQSQDGHKNAGLTLGTLYFLSDALGAWLALNELFDPKFETLLLMGVAAVFTILPAIGICLTWAFTGGRYLQLQFLDGAKRKIAMVVAAVIIAGLGYQLRVSRVTHQPTEVAPVPAKNPDPVLWIVIDTLRADTLYGDQLDFPLTPQFRELKDEFYIFQDAEAPAGWTLPSVATLMTGIHPTTLYSARGYLPNWAPTVAERLKRAGYRTHAFMDNYLLERRNGFAEGFDSFFQKSALRFAFTFPGFASSPQNFERPCERSCVSSTTEATE